MKKRKLGKRIASVFLTALMIVTCIPSQLPVRAVTEFPDEIRFPITILDFKRDDLLFEYWARSNLGGYPYSVYNNQSGLDLYRYFTDPVTGAQGKGLVEEELGEDGVPVYKKSVVEEIARMVQFDMKNSAAWGTNYGDWWATPVLNSWTTDYNPLNMKNYILGDSAFRMEVLGRSYASKYKNGAEVDPSYIEWKLDGDHEYAIGYDDAYDGGKWPIVYEVTPTGNEALYAIEYDGIVMIKPNTTVYRTVALDEYGSVLYGDQKVKIGAKTDDIEVTIDGTVVNSGSSFSVGGSGSVKVGLKLKSGASAVAAPSASQYPDGSGSSYTRSLGENGWYRIEAEDYDAHTGSADVDADAPQCSAGKALKALAGNAGASASYQIYSETAGEHRIRFYYAIAGKTDSNRTRPIRIETNGGSAKTVSCTTNPNYSSWHVIGEPGWHIPARTTVETTVSLNAGWNTIRLSPNGTGSGDLTPYIDCFEVDTDHIKNKIEDIQFYSDETEEYPLGVYELSKAKFDGTDRGKNDITTCMDYAYYMTSNFFKSKSDINTKYDKYKNLIFHKVEDETESYDTSYSLVKQASEYVASASVMTSTTGQAAWEASRNIMHLHNGVKVAYNVNASGAGTYTLLIYYGHNDATNRGINVTVNGGDTSYVSCGATGDWDHASSNPAKVSVSLNDGDNQIVFSGTDADGNPNYGPNIFRFEVKKNATTGEGSASASATTYTFMADINHPSDDLIYNESNGTIRNYWGASDPTFDSASEVRVSGGKFFPVDELGVMPSSNKWYSRDVMMQGKAPDTAFHNFLFTISSKSKFVFEREAGQYFDFTGDDDIYVFLNNKLIVDLGGAHSPLNDSISLDLLYKGQVIWTVENVGLSGISDDEEVEQPEGGTRTENIDLRGLLPDGKLVKADYDATTARSKFKEMVADEFGLSGTVLDAKTDVLIKDWGLKNQEVVNLAFFYMERRAPESNFYGKMNLKLKTDDLKFVTPYENNLPYGMMINLDYRFKAEQQLTTNKKLNFTDNFGNEFGVNGFHMGPGCSLEKKVISVKETDIDGNISVTNKEFETFDIDVQKEIKKKVDGVTEKENILSVQTNEDGGIVYDAAGRAVVKGRTIVIGNRDEYFSNVAATELSTLPTTFTSADGTVYTLTTVKVKDSSGHDIPLKDENGNIKKDASGNAILLSKVVLVVEDETDFEDAVKDYFSDTVIGLSESLEVSGIMYDSASKKYSEYTKVGGKTKIKFNPHVTYEQWMEGADTPSQGEAEDPDSEYELLVGEITIQTDDSDDNLKKYLPAYGEFVVTRLWDNGTKEEYYKNNKNPSAEEDKKRTTYTIPDVARGNYKLTLDPDVLLTYTVTANGLVTFDALDAPDILYEEEHELIFDHAEIVTSDKSKFDSEPVKTTTSYTADSEVSMQFTIEPEYVPDEKTWKFPTVILKLKATRGNVDLKDLT